MRQGLLQSENPALMTQPCNRQLAVSKRNLLSFIQPVDKSSSGFLEQNPLENLPVIEVETVPDRGEWAEDFGRVLCEEMFVKLFDDVKIIVQTLVKIRLFKATVQFQDIVHKAVDFEVIECKIFEKMAGDPQEIKSI
jgi:hypothetical protein